MSIRINDIPNIPIGYDLTGKVLMVHDLSAPNNANTKLIPISTLIGNTNNGISDGNKGNISVSNNGAVWALNNNVVTPAKMAKIAGTKLFGNPTTSSNDMREIQISNSFYFNNDTLFVNDDSSIQKLNIKKSNVLVGTRSTINFIQGSNINLIVAEDTNNNQINVTIAGTSSGGSGSLSDGDKGDIIVSATGEVWTINPSAIITSKINNNAVTFAKIQQIAASSLLGNVTSSAGNATELTLGSSLEFVGSTLNVKQNSTVQKVQVLNNGTLVGTRKAINFIVSNMTYSIADDSVNDRVNISFTGSAGGNGISVNKNGTLVGTKSIINFIEGNNTTIDVTQDSTKINVTVSAVSQNIVDNYVDELAFDSQTGQLRLGRTGSLADLTASLDGRYLTSLSHNHSIGNAAGASQFTFAQNEMIRFEGAGGTSVSFDSNTKKVIITSTSGSSDGNNYPSAVSFSNGTLTISRNGLADISTSLDGRYLTSVAHTHSIANATGTNQFSFAQSEAIRFEGTGNATVSFDAVNKKVIINSVAGSGADGNNYPTSLLFNTTSGILTLDRSGLSSLTINLDGRYLTSYTETDPIFMAHIAHNITSTDVTHWNTAYNKYPTGIVFSGTNTKTLTLTLNDGSTLTANFTDISGGGSGLVDGNKGDVTVSSSSATFTINSGVITGAKIATSVALAGSPTTTTQNITDNSTNIATTAYVTAKIEDKFNATTVYFSSSFSGTGSISSPIDLPLKTINGNSLIGNGNIVISSGGNISIDSIPTDGSSNAVESNGVFDALTLKQNALVSGTNIKTINGVSILGSGDIIISGGGSIADGSITGVKLASNISIPGSPTTTTPTSSDNSTKIATTAYVNTKLDETTIYFGNTFSGTGISSDPYQTLGNGQNKQVHNSGTTVLIENITTWLVVDPSSSFTSLTITLPAAPVSNQIVKISFGGVLLSGTVVTSLAVSPNTGQSIIQTSAPTSSVVGDSIIYQFNSLNSKWYKQ